MPAFPPSAAPALAAAHRVGESCEPPEPDPSLALLKLPRQITATPPQAGSDRVPACLYTFDTTGLTDLPLAVRRLRPRGDILFSRIDRVPTPSSRSLHQTLFLQFVVPVHTGASCVLGVLVSRSLDFQFRPRGLEAAVLSVPALPMRSGPGLQLLKARPVNPVFWGRAPTAVRSGSERLGRALGKRLPELAAVPANQWLVFISRQETRDNLVTAGPGRVGKKTLLTR